MPNRSRQRGVAIVYASVFLVALIGIVSLAVDWGRAQTAKTEMQDAVDAAARYAAAGLYDNSCAAKAQQVAAQNKVDGVKVTLAASDIETGYWNVGTRAFVLNGSPRNAVRVTGRRTAALGNAVPLAFGVIVGMPSVDVQAVGIARQSSLAAVGIDSFSLTAGNVRRKSTEGGGITIASNGSPSSNSGTTISGDALYRVTPVLNGSLTGRATLLPSDFTYPTPVVPGGTTTYSGLTITSGTNAVAGNIFVNGDLYVGGTANITLYSDTAVYCSGNATFTGGLTVTTNGYRLFVYSVGTGTITISNSYAIPIIVYAPTSPVVLSGPGMITGSAVGKTLTIGTTLEYSATSAIPFKATGGGDAMAAGGVITLK